MISTHSAKLSQEGRFEKAAAFYHFIASDRFRQMLDQIGKLTDELTGVDRSELLAHQRVWRRSAEVFPAVQKLDQDITSKIDGIIETSNE